MRIALLAALSLGLPGCAAVSGGGCEPAPAPPGIASLVEAWFTLLEDREGSSLAPDALLDGSSLDLALVETRIATLDGLRAWLSDFRAAHPQVEHRIGPLRAEAVADGLWEARFEVERRSVDQAGAPHIARRGHAWLVRYRPDAAPVIVRIAERALVPFPGTGPQIICN